MSDVMVDQVRRFNRIVTERVGALSEHPHGRERQLGAARLLWEIGLDGCEVRLLRARLGLDSGYVPAAALPGGRRARRRGGEYRRPTDSSCATHSGWPPRTRCPGQALRRACAIAAGAAES